MSSNTEDLLSELSSHIANISISVAEDDSPYIDLIESNFPFLYSNIDWHRVPDASVRSSVGDDYIHFFA